MIYLTILLLGIEMIFYLFFSKIIFGFSLYNVIGIFRHKSLFCLADYFFGLVDIF